MRRWRWRSERKASVCVCVREHARVSTVKAWEQQHLLPTDLGTRVPWRNGCFPFSGGESTR